MSEEFEDLNELHPLTTEPIIGFWNNVFDTLDKYPLLSFLFICSIIYLIIIDIHNQSNKK